MIGTGVRRGDVGDKVAMARGGVPVYKPVITSTHAQPIRSAAREENAFATRRRGRWCRFHWRSDRLWEH